MNYNMAGGRPNISDDDLRKAARMVRDSMLESLPGPSECEHEFSQDFYEKMEKLLSKERMHRTFRKAMQRVAVAFLAIVLGTGIWLSVDVEARAAVINWVREVYEDSVFYRFFNDSDVSLPVYRLKDIGDDYRIVFEDEDATSYSIFYRNDESGESIFFEYLIIQEGHVLGVLENQADYVHETVQIGATVGDYYDFTEKGSSDILVWIDEKNNIAFALNSTLEKDELLSIAEKIK